MGREEGRGWGTRIGEGGEGAGYKDWGGRRGGGGVQGLGREEGGYSSTLNVLSAYDYHINTHSIHQTTVTKVIANTKKANKQTPFM